jgi:hypothetical protein
VLLGNSTRPILESKNAIESLQREGILDAQLKIIGKWREAIDEVLKGRAIDQMTKDDVKLVVEAWWRLEFRPKNRIGR